MNELFLYFIFAIILYFVLSTIFDNFNIEQENFDPSLVPVSSIVTLAKVAQKLVNGNGTLTNPGNLQIGASTTTPGNLTVTGNSSIGGNLSVTGSTTFTGPVTFATGNFNIPSNLITTGTITAGSSTSAQTIKTWGPVESNSLTVGPGSTQFNGPVTAGANLNVTGDLQVSGILNAPGNIKIANSNPHITFSKTGQNSNPQIYSDGSTIHTYGGHFQADMNATVSGNTTLNGAVTVKNGMTITSGGLTLGKGGGVVLSVDGFTGYNGASLSPALFPYGANISNQLCIGSTCINETHLKILLGTQPIGLNFDKNNSTTNSITAGGSFLSACGNAPCGGNATLTSSSDTSRRASLLITTL